VETIIVRAVGIRIARDVLRLLVMLLLLAEHLIEEAELSIGRAQQGEEEERQRRR
jgi:hypothetical protein